MTRNASNIVTVRRMGVWRQNAYVQEDDIQACNISLEDLTKHI